MDLEEKFRKIIEKDLVFQQALELVRRNSTGKLWLIGGYLSRHIANILYGTGEPSQGDIDFIAEELTRYLVTGDWGVRLNSYGTPKFRKGDVRVDLVTLKDVLHIKRRHLEPTINNYLTGVPLTTQSIAYELQSGQILGEIGLKALRTRTIAINNYQSAESTQKRKGMTLELYLDKYAQSFGFKKV